MKRLLPMVNRDQGGGVAHRDTAPLEQEPVGEHLLPPALDSPGEGDVVTPALELDCEPLEALVGGDSGEEPLGSQLGAGLVCLVGDVIVDRDGAVSKLAGTGVS